MRISDWSSDVCSSDLGAGVGMGQNQDADALQTPFLPAEDEGAFLCVIAADAGEGEVHLAIAQRNLPRDVVLAGQQPQRDAPFELGRASCRGRGCRYV